MSVFRQVLRVAPFATGSLIFASTSIAFAHIEATSPQPRTGKVDIKDRPCGKDGSTRGEVVHTFQPGEIIEVTIDEFVTHPGYLRFAFDIDGDDDFVDPRSIDPSLELPSGGRACEDGIDGNGATDHCGAPDFCHNETVLVDHVDSKDSGGPAEETTYKIKLPDVECDNCTLQIIQVMSDIAAGFHGFYEPALDTTTNIYYECIDIQLVDQGTDPASFGEQPDLGPSAYICSKDALPDNNLDPLDEGGDTGNNGSDDEEQENGGGQEESSGDTSPSDDDGGNENDNSDDSGNASQDSQESESSGDHGQASDDSDGSGCSVTPSAPTDFGIPAIMMFFTWGMYRRRQIDG